MKFFKAGLFFRALLIVIFSLTPSSLQPHQVIYVSLLGDDISGDGTLNNPCLSVARGLGIANKLSSAADPITVCIGGGVFREDNSFAPLTITSPGITLRGESMEGTVLQPSTPAHDLFNITAPSTHICNLTLEAGVVHSTARGICFSSDELGVFRLNSVRISYFKKGLALSGTSQVFINNLYALNDEVGVAVEGNSLIIKNSVFMQNSSESVNIECLGAGASVFVLECLFDGTSHGSSSGVGLFCSKGACLKVVNSCFNSLNTAVIAGSLDDISATKMILSKCFFSNNFRDIVQNGSASLYVLLSLFDPSLVDINSPANVFISSLLTGKNVLNTCLPGGSRRIPQPSITSVGSLIGLSMAGDIDLGGHNIVGAAAVSAESFVGNLSGVASGNLPLTGGILTGHVRIPAGTKSVPSLYFSGSPTTGLSATGSALSLIASGAERMKVGSTGTISVNAFTSAGVVHNDGLGNLTSSLITNADVSPSAALPDSKLATLSTPGKVANSATTATAANLPSTIVARDSSNNFRAGTILATNLVGTVLSPTQPNITSIGGLTGLVMTGTLNLNQQNINNGATIRAVKFIGSLTGSASGNLPISGGLLTGPLILPAGSSSLPALNFLGSGVTGLSANGGALSLSTAGYERVKVGSTGAISINGFTSAGVVHNDGLGNLTSSFITNADVSPSAALPDSKLATLSTPGKVANSATTATAANLPSTIVARDSSNNFSAGTILATNLVGTVLSPTQRNITSVGTLTGLNVSNTFITGTGGTIFLNSIAQQGLQFVTPTTGGTTSIAATTSVVIFDIPTTIASHTISLPLLAINGQMLSFFAGPNNITAVTFTGGVVVNAPLGFAAPTSMYPNQSLSAVLIYSKANKKWYASF